MFSPQRLRGEGLVSPFGNPFPSTGWGVSRLRVGEEEAPDVVKTLGSECPRLGVVRTKNPNPAVRLDEPDALGASVSLQAPLLLHLPTVFALLRTATQISEAGVGGCPVNSISRGRHPLPNGRSPAFLRPRSRLEAPERLLLQEKVAKSAIPLFCVRECWALCGLTRCWPRSLGSTL